LAAKSPPATVISSQQSPKSSQEIRSRPKII
jgi:hypothetical protein